MNLLLTNDDGYEARGLQELKSELLREHNVFVVAPSGNRSSVSHCITMDKSLEVKKVSQNDYTCSGYPADCVITALGSELLPVKIDAVISGINKGANIGTDVVYSGTCAAARQAVFYKIPGVAVSVEHQKGYYAAADEYIYSTMAVFVRENLNQLLSLAKTEPPFAFVNVNALSLPEYKGMKIATELSRRTYNDRIDLMETSENGGSYKTVFRAGRLETCGSELSDNEIAVNGFVSVSRIYAEPISLA